MARHNGTSSITAKTRPVQVRGQPEVLHGDAEALYLITGLPGTFHVPARSFGGQNRSAFRATVWRGSQVVATRRAYA